ncbi:glycosyltransferase [[Clostridium] symbiosum]|nr:glycosyltransferase [[Clostridium] symbiosum]
MPSYNTGIFIREAVESVRKQTYKNWELLIVDDCSSDNTKKTIQEISDERIRFFENPDNRGAAYSRNFAIQKARGRWIAFLDSDDIWKPEKLERQLNFMRTHGYDFSYTGYEEIDEDSHKIGKIVEGPRKISRCLMVCYCWPGCLTVMYDAAAIGKIKIANLKKNNDYAMWLKISQKAVCYFLNENLADYRKRKGSISNSSPLKLLKYHYFLFRYGEQKNMAVSILLCINNVLFGCIKKVVYVHKKRKWRDR